ncbi:MAG: hypothetical protein CBB71_02615 [Rhodopirellula sp. TMED11]|nr:MAG: hypothetical protein CBB71_02615 [Rhodopirellula sp. TMED11]
MEKKQPVLFWGFAVLWVGGWSTAMFLFSGPDAWTVSLPFGDETSGYTWRDTPVIQPVGGIAMPWGVIFMGLKTKVVTWG